jgi:uncharacterized protein (TIGR00288 family)
MKSRHTHLSSPRAPVAPVHRGPQAMALSHALGHAPVGAAAVHAPNAALLIDFDNVTMGIRSDLQTELRNLLSSDIIQGKVAVQRAYADWRRYPQYIVPLSEASIDLIFAPAYGSSKKNATDIRLAIDALELVFTRPEIGTFILLSGDSDFSSLVIKLKEYGKYVIGVGIRESSSDLLVQNCDEYYSYNALAGLVKSGEVEPAHKWDPWELVSEAIGRMQQNHDVMRSDRLKQVMQEIDSNFDEKDLGHSKFSKFCHEAAQRGLIQTRKLENGQLEVSPPASKGSPSRPYRAAEARPAAAPAEDAAAASADATESAADAPAEGYAESKPEREGRSRRGRRGGRGRKRADAAPADAVATEATDGAPATAEAAEPAEASAAAPVTAEETADEQPAAAERAPRRSRTRRQPAAPRELDESIGVEGLRLTRDEAMGLVRDAVAGLVEGDASVPDEAVRKKAFELLGRDSESLSVRNFSRILRDAHDGDVIDLRRRGDGFEVARVVATPSVADQLEEREEAAKAAEPAPPAAAPVPRGMGPRSAPGRGGRGAKKPPAELLMVGVVDDGASTDAPAETAEPTE